MRNQTEHSMKRRSFTHEYSYRGYFHVTINISRDLPLWQETGGDGNKATANPRQPLGRVCGDLCKPDGDAEAPHVALSPIGQMVEQELLHSIPQHYPMLEVDEYVIMPEHLHILFHATRDIFNKAGKRTHLGRVIAGFKQGCNRHYWEMTGLIPASETQAIETPAAIGTTTTPQSTPAPQPTTTAAPQPTTTPQSTAAPQPTTTATPQSTTTATPQPTTAPQPTTPATPQSTTTAAPQSTTPAPPSIPSIALGVSIAEPLPSPSRPSLPPLFEPGYCDVIPVDEAQLETQRAYIRNNPRSRLMRIRNRASLMPRRGGIDTAVSLPAMCGYLRRVCAPTQFTPAIWEDLQKRFLVTDGRISCDSFGDRDLLSGRLLPVVCHRKDAALFPTQKARCLAAAAAGAILVSPRIARGEQEILDAAQDMGYPVVRIEDNGFTDRYHPSADKLAACAAGRLLLVTPWRFLFRRKDDPIHVPFCKAMNCIAQALCRTKDSWWKG